MAGNTIKSSDYIDNIIRTQQNSLYWTLFNMSSEPMMVSVGTGDHIEINRVIVDINNAFLDLTNYTRDEVIGSTVEAILGINPTRLVKSSLVLQERGSIVINGSIRNKKGRQMQVEIHVARFPYDSHNLHMAVIHDVTKHIETENKIKAQYRRELELKKALKNEVDSRAHFNRLLVHELKTQLTPMISASDALLNGLVQEPWHSLAEQINQSGRDINTRVDELIDIARSEVGLMELNFDLNSIRQLFEETAVSASIQTRQDGLLFSAYCDKSVDDRYGYFDARRIKQVINNLLNNAVKYNHEGGSIRYSMKVVNRSELLVCITDTGVGIPAEHLSHVFESYNTRYSVSKHSARGLGLGLALSKSIIELHHGHIQITSMEGRGTVASFTIPIHPVNLKSQGGKHENPDDRR
ncbi:MAG: PAS domain-containing sensor histidine kinase [Dehalococcoides mccartyi]|uniref:PAS domain-containing sensor histidine kinase n=1 Tax=Dehalococcoides mccartyi TaxID=61435 RepID=UPI0030F8E99E